MTETAEIQPLSTDARILHVLADTTDPVAEVAKLAVIGHLRAGHQVGLAAHRSILDRLDVHEDLLGNDREIEPRIPPRPSRSTRSTPTSTSSTVTASMPRR